MRLLVVAVGVDGVVPSCPGDHDFLWGNVAGVFELCFLSVCLERSS